MKPATSYIFLVRAENTHGLSVPSPVSSVVKTLGAENGVIPQSELAAARVVLSGKVNQNKHQTDFPSFFRKLLLTIAQTGPAMRTGSARQRKSLQAGILVGRFSITSSFIKQKSYEIRGFWLRLCGFRFTLFESCKTFPFACARCLVNKLPSLKSISVN